MTTLVFPTTLAARHDEGSAVEARYVYGAQIGTYAGPTGQAYAIPTRDEHGRALSYAIINAHIRNFCHYAASRPTERFHIASDFARGCFKQRLARMLKRAPSNVTRVWIGEVVG